MRLEFVVYGTPAAKGSLVANVPIDKQGRPLRYKKSGRIVVYQKEQNSPRLGPWMAAVAEAARKAMGDRPPIRGPVMLSCVFRFGRPKYHYGTGRNQYRVKASAPVDHIKTPDLSKLIRAIEDAIAGIVYGNDSQINRFGQPLEKEWTVGHPLAKVIIESPETVPDGVG